MLNKNRTLKFKVKYLACKQNYSKKKVRKTISWRTSTATGRVNTNQCVKNMNKDLNLPKNRKTF